MNSDAPFEALIAASKNTQKHANPIKKYCWVVDLNLIIPVKVWLFGRSQTIPKPTENNPSK